jgi:hypothetical protein
MASNPKLGRVQSVDITRYRAAVKQLLAATEMLRGYHVKWDALGYPASLVDEAFVGPNGDLTAEKLAACRAVLEQFDVTMKAGAPSPYTVLYQIGS